MTIELPQGVSAVTKKGQTYYRYRWYVAGQREEQMLKGIVGVLTPELLAAIEAAVDAIVRGDAVAPKGPKLIERKNVANPGTWGLAWRIYQQEDEDWEIANPSTRRNRTDVVEDFLDSAILEGNDTTWKEIAVGATSRVLLEAMIKATRKRAPSQALKLLRALRGLVRTAISKGWIKPQEDPTYMMKVKKTKGAWLAWPEHEQAAFELRHPMGTTPRHFYEFTRWLGQRQGDVCLLNRGQIKVIRTKTEGGFSVDRYFVIAQEKNAKRRQGGAKIAPVLVTPMIDEVLAHIPAEQHYLLLNRDGKPFAKSGMTTCFANWREQAGLSRSGYSQHGLRKVLGGVMATAGTTSKESAAVLGHDDLKHVELYSVSADNVVMARNAGNKVVKLVRG